ncbi:REP-associated tyrosine transposase [Pseudomonas sp. Hp2]|uniref:REP-associated tyrosine transposase n=1 Tax=Pseudomonas sp. Hp2 TaxID=701189 RepID=UPI001C497EF8|nr:transposase [Pseudomonas sp. Hp2]
MDIPGQSISPGYSSLRRGRCSGPGRIYLLTTVAEGRVPLFADWRCAQAVAACLISKDTWIEARLLCWVLMPDHWHGLLELEGHASLARVMKRMKGRAAREVNRARGRGGAVWMEGFHDRAVRAEEDLRAIARYVIANPLRAGLVGSIGQYPYWDAIWLEGRERP